MMTPKEAKETSEALYKAQRITRRLREAGERVFAPRVLEELRELRDLVWSAASRLQIASLDDAAPESLELATGFEELPSHVAISGMPTEEVLDLVKALLLHSRFIPPYLTADLRRRLLEKEAGSREAIRKLEDQLQFADGVAISALCVCGQATPAEGFRKAGWGWMGHHIGEIAKERDEARSQLEERRARDEDVRHLAECAEFHLDDEARKSARALLAAPWLKKEGAS